MAQRVQRDSTGANGPFGCNGSQWLATGATDLVGSDGATGDDGKSVQHGSSDPTSNDGAEG